MSNQEQLEHLSKNSKKIISQKSLKSGLSNKSERSNKSPLKSNRSSRSNKNDEKNSVNSDDIKEVLKNYPEMTSSIKTLTSFITGKAKKDLYYKSTTKKVFVKNFKEHLLKQQLKKLEFESKSKKSLFENGLQFLINKKNMLAKNDKSKINIHVKNKYDIKKVLSTDTNKLNGKNFNQSETINLKNKSTEGAKSYSNIHLQFLQENRELVNNIIENGIDKQDDSNMDNKNSYFTTNNSNTSKSLLKINSNQVNKISKFNNTIGGFKERINNIESISNENVITQPRHKVKISVPASQFKNLNSFEISNPVFNNNTKHIHESHISNELLWKKANKKLITKDYIKLNSKELDFPCISNLDTENILSSQGNAKKNNVSVKSIIKRSKVIGGKLHNNQKINDAEMHKIDEETPTSRTKEIVFPGSTESKASKYLTSSGFNYSYNRNTGQNLNSKTELNINGINGKKSKFVENGIYFSKNKPKQKSFINKSNLASSYYRSSSRSKANRDKERDKISNFSNESYDENQKNKAKKNVKNSFVFNNKQQSEIINEQKERMRRKLSNFIVFSNHLNTENSKNTKLSKNTTDYIKEYNYEFSKSDPKIVKIKNFLETMIAPEPYKQSVYYILPGGLNDNFKKKAKIVTDDKTNIFYKSHFIGSLSNDIAYKYRDKIADDHQDNSYKHFMNAYYSSGYQTRKLLNDNFKNDELLDNYS